MSLDVGCLSLVGSSLFLSVVVLKLVLILVFLWEEVSSRSFYSAILSPLQVKEIFFKTKREMTIW